MATIVVRGLEPEVVRALKIRGAQRGHSMEEEARQLIRERVQVPSRQGLESALMSIPGYGWEWPRA